MSGTDERDLLGFAAEIARYPRPGASAALRARLRRSLMEAPLAPQRRSASAWLRTGPLRQVLAAAVILAVIVPAGGSAAASSLPGDAAFPVKRAAEQAQLALARDDASRLDILVAQSDHRLAELVTAAQKRPGAATPATEEYRAAVGRVDAVLVGLLTLPATSARDAAIARATAASADHIAALATLAGRLPAAAQPGIEHAIEAQETVRGKSGDLPIQPGDPGGRPSNVPGGPPPGRGGPPVKVPGRP